MDGMIWGLWHFKHTQIVAASCFDSTDFVGILAGSYLLLDIKLTIEKVSLCCQLHAMRN